MKKKEFLIIFVLAILITGGSWFYFRDEGCLIYPWGASKGIFCRESRGWPLVFWQSKIKPFMLLTDCLFWFLVLVIGWLVIKKILRKFLR